MTSLSIAMPASLHDPSSRLRRWILYAATSPPSTTAVDYVRRPRFDCWDSDVLVTADRIDQMAVEAPAPADTPTPPAYRRNAAAVLHWAIARLRPEYRRCIILRYVEQRSYESIAETMNVPVGTVGTHLSRARKELRRMLGPSSGSAPSDPDQTRR